MKKTGTEKYDYGIYNGLGVTYDYKDKERNVRNNVLYMLNRTLQMFDYEGLPETIPARELERLLQTNGFAGITEVKGELHAFYGGLGGEQGVYGRATTLVVSNVALKFNKTLTIDDDVVLMRNDDMQLGIVPILSKFSTLMNENEITIILNLMTKRVNNLISVADDNTAESAKLFLKKLEKGEIGYIFENKLFNSLKTSDFGKDSADISELIELQQYLKAGMYNEVGLNANPNMKKERMITSEIEVNSESLYPLVDNMLDSRREALEKINEKYDTDIKVEFNSSWNYRINQGEKMDKEAMAHNQELEQQQEQQGFGFDSYDMEEDFSTKEAIEHRDSLLGDDDVAEGDSEAIEIDTLDIDTHDEPEALSEDKAVEIDEEEQPAEAEEEQEGQRTEQANESDEKEETESDSDRNEELSTEEQAGNESKEPETEDTEEVDNDNDRHNSDDSVEELAEELEDVAEVIEDVAEELDDVEAVEETADDIDDDDDEVDPKDEETD